MNTTNNAAALERLEQIVSMMAKSAPVHNRAYYLQVPQSDVRDLNKALAELRTLAQPDALTSQPSGEAVSIPVVQQTAPERIWLAVADDAYYADKPFPDGEEVCWSSDAPLQVCVPYVRADLATHPSADAPGPSSEFARGVEFGRADERASRALDDAPGVAVDEAMVSRALAAAGCNPDLPENSFQSAFTRERLRAALTAALAPKPEGGHG